MITTVKVGGVYVVDQDQAVQFYVGALGWEKVADMPSEEPGARWIEVRIPQTTTVVILAKAGYGDAGHQPGTFSGLVLETDDAQALYEEWQAKGVHFIEPPTIQPWGMKQGIFQDPDGNRFVLVEPLTPREDAER